MKATISISLLLASLIPSAFAGAQKTYPGGAIDLDDSVVNSAAYPSWMAAQVHLPTSDVVGTSLASTDATAPAFLFALFCDGVGFKSGCQAYGGRPGRCLKFKDFGDVIDNKVSSLSTSNGENLCQFYTDESCGASGADTGVSLHYAYDLGSKNETLYQGIGPFNGNLDNKLSSWVC